MVKPADFARREGEIRAVEDLWRIDPRGGGGVFDVNV